MGASWQHDICALNNLGVPRNESFKEVNPQNPSTALTIPAQLSLTSNSPN